MFINLSELLAQYQNKSFAFIFAVCVINVSGCGGSSSNASSSGEQTQPQIQDQPQVTEGDVAGSDFYRTANNAALLSGPLVGSAASSNSSLIKELPFTLAQTDSPIEIRKIYKTRLSESDSFPGIVAVIRNNSESIQCGVRFKGLLFLDSNGTPLEDQLTTDLFFTIGSMGDSIFSSSYDQRCLASGEEAYAVRTSLFDYAGVEMISFNSVSTREGVQYSSVQEVVMPISYEVNDASVDITIANQSSVSLIVRDYDYFLLDEQGSLVGYVSGLISPNIELLPGAEAILERRDRFEGASSTLRVVLDFTPSSLGL